MSSFDHTKYPLPNTSYTRRKVTNTLSIHCSETTAKQDIGVKEIREWHVNERGWIDGGYNIVIRRSGAVEPLRPLWAVPAAVEGHNSTMLAVCLVGGCDAKRREENNFTDEQWDSLRVVVRSAIHIFPITDIKGHREFPKVTKYCPSFDVAAWLRQNKKVLG